MRDRPQINIRLDRDLLAELDNLASEERVDRSEIARRALDEGLAARRSARALEDYRQGRISAWKAAEIARVSLYEMLDRIHEAGIPYELDPLVLDRLGAGRNPGAIAAVRESAAPYQAGGPDAASGIAELREQFRPERVQWLFVGESSPAGGTHFYRANSNLFRATRDAYARAFGADAVPDGPAFLHEFRGRGAWLVDLAEGPVNRMPGRARAGAVDAGVDRLSALIHEVEPERIVVVKASITGAVRQAAAAAGFAGDILELPFPVRQWRAVYVRRLVEALRAARHL